MVKPKSRLMKGDISITINEQVIRIEALIKDRVCACCGGKLTAKNVWDDVVHSVCESCATIDYGVFRHQFELGERCVEEGQYNKHVPDQGWNSSSDEKEYCKMLNIRDASRLFSWYDNARQDQT